MALTLPPPIVQKTLAAKALQFQDGKVYLWDTPCFLDPIQVQTYYHKLIENSCGYEQANRIRYYTAKLQSLTGMKIINNRFGYAETIKEKENLVLFNNGQTEMLGIGKFEWLKIDFENELFICKTVSPFAEDYRRFFGMQKSSIDFWLMGAWAGAIESIVGKKMLNLEGSCIAKGDSHCEFIIKPIEKWDKNDPLFKQHEFLLREEPNIKELGGSMETYTKLK